MTDEERDAMAWLGHMAELPGGKYVPTILRMLARPVLPEEPTEEILGILRVNNGLTRLGRFHALKAELTHSKGK